MVERVALIGFGEAARAFLEGFGRGGAGFAAYDLKTDDPATRAGMFADYVRFGVDTAETASEAVAGAAAVVSLVTADQALAAARATGAAIPTGALYFDLNSVAPDTKRAAAQAVEAGGGRYVDVAVLSPVRPLLNRAPLLVSGPWTQDGAETLRRLGFTDVTAVEGPVGAASAIKMIRSVMVKGIEALSAECMLAAHKAGVADAVIASLDASWPGADWGRRADYNLDRMMIHGLRRAAEMEEVVKTLESLGVGAELTRGTVKRQRAIGKLGLKPPPEGLAAKVAAILKRSG
jgi:3-hydroxyisobutyrate dehydrogenase-like beta-hydroxyacid dehydrogenase